MVVSRKLPGNKLSLIASVVALIICYSGMLVVMAIPLPVPLDKIGHWQFLTILSLLVSILVFILNIIAQLTKNIHVFHIKNELHSIAFTLESIVAIVYWPLKLFFIHLINNRGESLIPLLVDLAIHLVPVVALGIDYYFFMPQWMIKTSHAYIVCLGLSIGYWLLLETSVKTTGIYPYPFLNVDFEARIVIFAFVTHVAFGNFVLQRKLHDTIIGEEIDDTYKEE